MSDPPQNPLQPLVNQLVRLSCRIEELLLKIGNGGSGTGTIVVYREKTPNAENKRVTVGTTPLLILPANPNRVSLSLINIGAVTIYLSPMNNVTGSNGSNPGFDLVSGGTAYDENYTGPIYGVVQAGSSALGVWEESK